MKPKKLFCTSNRYFATDLQFDFAGWWHVTRKDPNIRMYMPFGISYNKRMDKDGKCVAMYFFTFMFRIAWLA